MNDPSAILKRDHREVRAMLKELAASSPGRARATALRQLERELTLHMDIEERILYPVVAELEGDEAFEEAEVEHRLAREGLVKANEMLSTPGFGAVIAMLQGGIEHHVAEEEKEILPQLKQRLQTAEWRALGDRIAEEKDKGRRRNGRSSNANGRSSAKSSTTSSASSRG